MGWVTWNLIAFPTGPNYQGVRIEHSHHDMNVKIMRRNMCSATQGHGLWQALHSAILKCYSHTKTYHGLSTTHLGNTSNPLIKIQWTNLFSSSYFFENLHPNFWKQNTSFPIPLFSKWSKTLTLSRPVKNQIRPKPTLQSASKHLTDFTRSSSPHSRDQCFGPQRSCTRNAQEPETLWHKEQKGSFNPCRIKKSWNAWASELGQKTKTQKFKKLIPKKWWFRTHQHGLFTGI